MNREEAIQGIQDIVTSNPHIEEELKTEILESIDSLTDEGLLGVLEALQDFSKGLIEEYEKTATLIEGIAKKAENVTEGERTEEDREKVAGIREKLGLG